MPRIAIVVGEASGDSLARGLIEAVRAACPDAEFVGITGPQLEAAGCESWGDYRQLAVMGIIEVVRHIPSLRRLMNNLQQRLLDAPPDLLVGVDAPDFNLRLEAFARRHGIPTVHYVCPSVWAWREGRVKTIRRSCDRVLCLLPFEAEFLRRHEIDGVFVGHPLADEIGDGIDQASCRRELGIDAGEWIALLPGSRAGEVAALGDAFLETLRLVRAERPGVRALVAAANAELAAEMAERTTRAGLEAVVEVRTGQTRTILGAADAVLLSSGTATLETMLMRRPMVVAYRINALTAWIVRRLVRIDYAALPNLLAGRQLVPEFLQEDMVPERMAAALLAQLDDQAGTEQLLAEFTVLAEQLRQGASARAAAAVLEMLPGEQRVAAAPGAITNSL